MGLPLVAEQPRLKSIAAVLARAVTGNRVIALLLMLTLGLLPRLWDIAQPFLGYHGWNEVYYVTIARNFEHFGLLSLYNYDATGGSPLSQRLGPSPFVPWLVYFSSALLGTAEWVARLPILILGMFSLLALYFIARELYGHGVGLTATFLAAIMPGAVFFSRQIALDGPMTAFGLGAVWMMLLAERRRQYRWVLLSAMLLAVAIFIKYTAALFIPSLAWLWLKMVRHGARPRNGLIWARSAICLAVAALPAIAWFTLGTAVAVAQSTQSPWSGYLNRAYEFAIGNWVAALQAAWTRAAAQLGPLLWYYLLVALILALLTSDRRALVKQHLGLILLTVPWFAQIAYPVSWYQNDAYTYPALYGVAVLLALLLRGTLRLAQATPVFSARSLGVAVVLLGVLAYGSSLWDYRQTYRSWYHSSPDETYRAMQLPANLVTPGDPFMSARMVRFLNDGHEPVLADLPETLYYAQDEYWRGRAVWLWKGLGDEQDRMVAAIESREYSYVVFTYFPSLDITYALVGSGYYRIGPAVWVKAANP